MGGIFLGQYTVDTRQIHYLCKGFNFRIRVYGVCLFVFQHLDILADTFLAGVFLFLSWLGVLVYVFRVIIRGPEHQLILAICLYGS